MDDFEYGTLADYATDPDAYNAALARVKTTLQPTRLHVVTAGPSTEPTCTGTMTCNCPNCGAQVIDLVRRGSIGNGAAQPWEPRPARQRAA